jgi:hypothetical protein
MIFMEVREKGIIQAIRFCSLNVADVYEAYGEKWLTGIRRLLDWMRQNHRIKRNPSNITRIGIGT